MLNISFAGCLGQSSVISTPFTLEMCVAASQPQIAKKITNIPYFWVQGRSRGGALKLTDMKMTDMKMQDMFQVSE